MYGRVARTRCARNFAPLRARLFATDYSKYGLSPGGPLCPSLPAALARAHRADLKGRAAATQGRAASVCGPLPQ